MKFKIFSMLLTMGAVVLTGCKSDYDALSDGNHRYPGKDEVPKLYKIPLCFGGDYVSEAEEPLLRGDGDGDTFVGVNVYRTSKDGGTQEEFYAYGVYQYDSNSFDPSETGITIDVYSGYTYRFESTVLTERENKMDLNDNCYSEPFMDSDGYTFRRGEMGSMIYGDKKNLPGLSSGTAKVNIIEARNLLNTPNVTVNQFTRCGYPQVKRFYGTNLDPFDPLFSDKVTIIAGYKNFELKIETGKIPEGTYVELQDVKLETSGGMPNDGMAILFPNGLKFASAADAVQNKVTSWSGLYSMNNLSENGTDTFTLKFYWNKGDGNPKTFEVPVTVKPKMRKILTINITGESSTKSEGSIVFDMDDENLTDDSQTISKDFSTN